MGYDPFGGVVSLNSKDSDPEIAKMLLNHIICSDLNKQIYGKEGDYVGSLIKCINDGTSDVRHRQIFSRKGMLRTDIENIVR
eukprot:CAMPEP_0170487776 /NCGR_PEP_ID=MMETSP0208-20121228/6512_1 /TAXON_ID=197538 /ORGANISM="Strombidium inclinatum, Strain S3" /LENGTH=81 /DNA_ID=CAMNT_0010762167 /DNA_START=528 /DNA_END=773 /DNA_ORIENTATION=-